MKKYEKTQFRLTCLNQAINLKQSTATVDEYKDKNVVDIAKELEEYVLGNSNTKTKKD
jgi:hypothetical protein